MTVSDGGYQIARSTGQCAATQSPLEPGASCVATLCKDTTNGGLQRLDYTIAAWEEGARPEGLFSFWRTTVPEPQVKKRVFVEDEVLLDLIDSMADDHEPRRVAFRFVIALVLLRKRLVRFDRREETSEGIRWHLSRRGDAECQWTVDDPALCDDDIVDLHEQLGEVLQGDL